MSMVSDATGFVICGKIMESARYIVVGKRLTALAKGSSGRGLPLWFARHDVCRALQSGAGEEKARRNWRSGSELVGRWLGGDSKGLFLQGLNKFAATEASLDMRTEEQNAAQADELSITSQFRAVAHDGVVDLQALDLPDDRRNRAERRRTRNPVFEARARRVGMALDRRRRRGWLAAIIVRVKRGLRSLLGLHRARDSAAQH